MDTILLPILDDLRACVCGSLEGTLGGTVECACLIVPGVEAVADWCACGNNGGGCGMAWVRLDRLYSSSASFPAQDAKPLTCAKVLAAVIEVGIFRCLPTSKGNGQPPDPAAQAQAALMQSDDAMALAQAIECCEAITKRPHVLGTYSPRGGGACGGGAWTVTVQLTRRA